MYSIMGSTLHEVFVIAGGTRKEKVVLSVVISWGIGSSVLSSALTPVGSSLRTSYVLK